MKRSYACPLFAALAACGEANTKSGTCSMTRNGGSRAECRNDAKEQVSADCQNALAAEAQVVTMGKGVGLQHRPQAR
jgi:hypothetical protein